MNHAAGGFDKICLVWRKVCKAVALKHMMMCWAGHKQARNRTLTLVVRVLPPGSEGAEVNEVEVAKCASALSVDAATLWSEPVVKSACMQQLTATRHACHESGIARQCFGVSDHAGNNTEAPEQRMETMSGLDDCHSILAPSRIRCAFRLQLCMPCRAAGTIIAAPDLV